MTILINKIFSIIFSSIVGILCILALLVTVGVLVLVLSELIQDLFNYNFITSVLHPLFA